MASAALVALVGACQQADHIELRLGPCTPGSPPGSLRIAIQPLDGSGAAIGDRKDRTFTIDDPAIFGDGVATVGYVPPAGAVQADFTVAWFAGPDAGPLTAGDELLERRGVDLPPLGGSLDLIADSCEPGMTTESTTVDPTTMTTAESESATTGTATEGMTGTTETTEGTEGTTEETTEGTTEGTTTDETESESETETESDTETDTETGSNGGPCTIDEQGLFRCETPGPGQVGTVYRCDQEQWVEDTDRCESACSGVLPPVAVGCSGNNDQEEWSCLCGYENPQSCEPSEASCTPKMGGSPIVVCDEGKQLVYGICPGLCKMEPEGPTCLP